MSSNLQSKVSLCLTKNLPFVIYSLPNSPQVELLMQRTNETNLAQNISLDKLDGFLIAPFSFKQQSDLHFVQPEIYSADLKNDEHILDLLHELKSNDYQSNFSNLEQVSKSDYVAIIEKAIQSLHEHSLPKIVVSRTQLTQSVKKTTAQVFEEMLQKYSGAFRYLLYLPSYGVWMGATPEQFIQVNGNEGSTMALAGTKKDHSTEWTKKEQGEHQIVTDHIQHVLNKNSIPYITHETTTLDTGAVQHLCTKIELTDVQPGILNFDVLNQLHPTPAVCGNPVDRAQQLISELESHSRELYCGFLGPINKLQMNLFVNLRCMKFVNNAYQLFLGGGITKDSIPEHEWNETALKAITLQSILG